MERRPLGQTGELVAPLGIGSLSLELGEDRLEQLYSRLLDVGCNVVDTAAIYDLGEHESFIGRRLSERRDDFLLITKCGHHEQLPDGSLRSLDISIQDIDQSLQRLRTDRIDAMLLHSTDLEPLQAGEHLEVLRLAQQQGKIRWFGYSGDNERAEWAVSEGGSQVLECSFNLADQHNGSRGMQAARKTGCGVIAKKPIAAAMWNLLGRAEDAHPVNRPYVQRLMDLNLQPEDYGCETMGELALRFCIAYVDCAIVSSRSEIRQDENLATATKGPLSLDHCEQIRKRFLDAEENSEEELWLGCN